MLQRAGPGTRERAAELCQGCAASEGGAACPPLARDWQAPPGFTRLPPGYVFLRRAALVCHVAVPGSGFGLCVPAEARPGTTEAKSSLRQLCGRPRAESCSLAGTCCKLLPVASAPPSSTPQLQQSSTKVPLQELHQGKRQGGSSKNV